MEFYGITIYLILSLLLFRVIASKTKDETTRMNIVRETKSERLKETITETIKEARKKTTTDVKRKTEIFKAERFNAHHTFFQKNEPIDAIIIGSGISGLICAATLSKNGKKRVVILEQHNQVAGGCTHQFSDKGYEFDSGIHYVGENQGITKLLNSFVNNEDDAKITNNNDNVIEWTKIGNVTKDPKFIYDKIVIGKDEYVFPAGKEAWRKQMCEYFPNEILKIHQYLELAEKVYQEEWYFKLKLLPWNFLRRWLRKLLCPLFEKYIMLTMTAVLDEMGMSTRLKAVISAQFGNLGPIPDQLPFYLGASVFLHYIEGAYYPRGGSKNFLQILGSFITKRAGIIFYNANVKEIMIRGGVVKGVLMTDGTEIYSNTVIASCSIMNTIERLVPKVNWSPITRKRWENLMVKVGPSIAYNYLFLGFTLDSLQDKIPPAYNLWCFPHDDYARVYKHHLQHTDVNTIIVEDNPAFIAFGSTKDDSWEENHKPGIHTAVVLCAANPNWFSDFGIDEKKERDQDGALNNKRKTKTAKRNQEYKDRKSILEDKMFQIFKNQYPEYACRLTYCEGATTLTNNFYLNSLQGEVYGLNVTASRFLEYDDLLSPRTEIKGLYLSGSDIFTVGLGGGLWSGFVTAHTVLGTSLYKLWKHYGFNNYE